MKPLNIESIFLSWILCISIFAQGNFTLEEYDQFLQQNQNLTTEDILLNYPAQNPYYKSLDKYTSIDDFFYLDSILMKYQLTDQEIELLKNNHFVVTERLSFDCFGRAFHDIYSKDLPVMITTDAILHALHASYDQILIDVEIAILKPNLEEVLDGLYAFYPLLLNKYKSNTNLKAALEDVDLYVTIALSLLQNSKLSPQFTSQEKIDEVWEAIQNEQYIDMPLFSERDRHLDFSQFTVRGHYDNDSLREYFKTMMWLGRIDFFLTPPPENPWEEPWSREEIRRMNLSAYMLNELIDMADMNSLLDTNDEIIRFMVGESDNLTPSEFDQIINDLDLTSAEQLLHDPTYDDYLETLKLSSGSGQKILSSLLMMDPFSSEPGELPISYRLMGQRFIIDSYIFSNVVFDRIVYENKKIWRPLPDPLDAMFVLGNEDALPLLKEEIDTYKYASQLSALSYLVGAYDEDFWDSSLYNVWLQCIRFLNPSKDRKAFPLFMQTAAWQQQKLNTQLASWSQLRHDNLLYAKQSYTGMTGCSFPHSFFEPYPAFYKQIGAFAERANFFFSRFTSTNPYLMNFLLEYFSNLELVMKQIQDIVQKEVDGIEYDNEEIEFLKTMLFEDGMSGEPPFSGWYPYLYYHPDDAAFSDYLVADVHTQPTDAVGNIVGRVLHVGTSDINLGVFLAYAPSNQYEPTAFVGPVMSYYEKITDNFDRLTDQRWESLVYSRELPERPDWVNVYLADAKGNRRNPGREISAEIYTGIDDTQDKLTLAPEHFAIYPNYPNPFNASTMIRYILPKESPVELAIYDIAGQLIERLVDSHQPSGVHEIQWNAGSYPSGIYFCRLRSGAVQKSIKIMLVR